MIVLVLIQCDSLEEAEELVDEIEQPAAIIPMVTEAVMVQ